MSIPSYLIAAYIVFWAFTFGFSFSIWARQRRIEQQIAALATLGVGQEPVDGEP